MPWYCITEFCSNIGKLKKRESYPMCGKKAQNFGLFGKLPLDLQEQKWYAKEWKSSLVCQKCGSEMIRVSHSSPQYDLDELEYDKYYVYETICRSFPVDLCIKCGIVSGTRFQSIDCGIVSYDLPPDFLKIWIGKIVRGIDRGTGIMRFRVEYRKNGLG